MRLKIQMSSNLEVINKQIKALEWEIEQDTSSKDIFIHKKALEELKERQRQLQAGD